MNRPRVDLGSLGAVLDRLLDHLMAAVADELLPQTMGAVRAVRADLPAMASGLEAHAVERVAEEARALEAELVGSLTRWVKDTIRKGRGERVVRGLRGASIRAPRRPLAARKAKGKKR